MIKKIFFLQMIFSTVLFAQNNVVLLSNLDEYHSDRYSDIWGYVDPMGNEYALLQVRTGTSVIDLSDPTNPYEISFIPGPDTRTRDVKVHGEYAYVVGDKTNTTDGLQIIDLSNLPESAFLVKQVNTWFNEAHNLFIDNGFAYVVGADEPGGGIHILDLSDPVNPTHPGYYSGSGSVHDVYVWDDTLVASTGTGGEFHLLDVTDKANPQLISASYGIPGTYAHSGWMTEDKKYFYSTEERNVTDITVWDLQDRSTWDIALQSWAMNSDAVAHNLFILGNYAHLSYYKDGYVILDISNPESPVLAGQYSTDSMWGCYPYLPSGITICSDKIFGLYVFSFDGNLPVELSAFTANFKDDKIVLEWKTETEVNNYGFDIDRSTDNSNWMAIGFVEGHGNSNSPKQYTFNDTDIQQSGIYYYRLKQTDNDGTFEYSDVVAVTVGVPVLFALSQNYPNPFNPETRIDYTIPKQQNVSLRVYNMLGELVKELVNEVKESGSYSVTFDASNLPSGIYIYRIQTEGFSENKKMTLLK